MHFFFTPNWFLNDSKLNKTHVFKGKQVLLYKFLIFPFKVIITVRNTGAAATAAKKMQLKK